MADHGEHGELLAAIVRRDNAAFERLVSVYQHRLFNFALRYAGSREDAEEAVQDTFVKAYRALYWRLPPERVLGLALTPWLYRIALNTLRNRARSRQEPPLPLPAEEGDELALPLAAAGGLEAGAELADLRSALVRELLRLPPPYRAALVLRFVEGLSYPEIAQATGRPLGTVKSDVHRAALAMRPRLRRWCDGDDAEEDLAHAL